LPAWENELNKTISLSDLYGIAEAIEAIYLKAGYFSDVVVPHQDYESGHITIKVYAPGFEEITVESDIPNIEQRLKPYIDRLMALVPIPVAEVERSLLLISDLGGLTIEGKATRPQHPGAGGHLHLQVTNTPTTAQVGI